MSTGRNLSYDSVGNSIQSPVQGSYDAGSYLAKVIGKSEYHKMPIYDKRTTGEGLHSNLPSPTDLSHNSENFNGGNPNAFPYRGPDRSYAYESYHSSYYHNRNTQETYDVSQNRRHSTNHVSFDEDATSSHSSELPSYQVPNTEDVKTIAFQMRTMPNYFAAMAAAASLNVNYPNMVTEQENEYRTQPHEGQQIKPSYRPKHYEESYPSNASIVSSRSGNGQGEKSNIELTRSHLDVNSELQDMLNIRSSSLPGSEINDIDNPKHKYYLKVCYICKETTTKEHCIHYGALACFSCRAFFRRSHQSMQDKGRTADGKRKLPEFVCKKTGKCNVTPKTRRRCQKCRYDLCIKAGMQPEAVMTEDQVKVRFRKMFTKRGENKDTAIDENKSTEDNDNETYQNDDFVESERRKSLDAQTDKQLQYIRSNEICDSRTGRNEPMNHSPQMTPTPPGYQYKGEIQVDVKSIFSNVNYTEGTSYHHPTNIPTMQEDRVYSNVFDTAPKDFPAHESSTSLKNENECFYKYIHVSKKQRILGSIIDDYPTSVARSIAAINSSETSNETSIKQENTESPEPDIDFFSLSDEEKTTPNDPLEPKIEMIEFDDVKRELESSDSQCNMNDARNSSTNISNTNMETSTNDGEKFDNNSTSEENVENEIHPKNFAPIENLHDSITSEYETPDLKKVDDSSPCSDASVDPFDDIEKSIDFNKITGPNINEPKQRTPSPPVFKSPTLPILKIKKLKMKQMSRMENELSTKTVRNCQNPDGCHYKSHKFNRLHKRLADLETSYKIACSQIYFPDNIVNKLINFHLGCATAQKEDFLSCANSASKFFRHFALMHREFGNLSKPDQMLLLGKNTPLYVQFVFASYFCQSSGHEQLSSLLGKKYLTTMKSESSSCHVLKKITATEFCHSVKLFSRTASFSVWEKMLDTFKRIKIESKYIPCLCLLILYDTNNSTFWSSQDHESSPDSTAARTKFEDNLKDPKKVQEIRKKCEQMISLVGSEDNSLLSAILLEDKENVNKMNNLIKILGHLSMFYTYNTNWDNKNLPGYSKIDSKLLDEPIKSRSPTKKALGTIEAHTFHLSMPYTNEEELWLENKFDMLKKAYASVSIGEDLVNEFVMYSFDVPLSKKFFPLCHNAFLERSWRIYKKHAEFQALTLSEQNIIWKTNANKANALFMVRSQICSNGLVQLQDCIGELDTQQFSERYLPLLRTTKLRKMSFFDAVMSSGMSIPEDLMNQAKNLIQQIGPFVEDQEYLQLICLLQMLKPPRNWMDQPAELLTPAQKNLINLYEKYWILIHRRFKWKIKTKDSPAIGRYKADEPLQTPDVSELSRRRKRKASQNDDTIDCITRKAVMLNCDTSKEKYRVLQCDREPDSLNAIKSDDDILTDAELMTDEELENLNNNGSEGRMEFIKYNYKADLAEFELEEERLNSESWHHFEELMSVVCKIEKLSDIFDEIQALLHTVVVKKDDYSI